MYSIFICGFLRDEVEGKLKEARGEGTGNLHLAAVADQDKLLASAEKIMEDMVKEDLMVEVDNLRHFTVKGVEELVTLVEDLDSIRGRGVAESYVAVLTWNKEEGLGQVLVFPSTNLQGKG